MTDRNLIDAAAASMANAYTPYSRLAVGAALECSDGTVYVGCNIENASFGATMCAEATAIGTAVAAGKREFRRIAIISGSGSYCFPCGTCRQMLYEFSPGVEVLSARLDGRYVSYALSALLPMAFGKEHIE